MEEASNEVISFFLGVVPFSFELETLGRCHLCDGYRGDSFEDKGQTAGRSDLAKREAPACKAGALPAELHAHSGNFY